jgi:chromosomal replication initiator protein
MTNESTTHQAKRAAAAVEKIKEIVAAHFGFPVSSLTDKNRTQPLATRRQIAMKLAYEETASSSPDVARAFQRDDHMTVLHAVRAIEKKTADDADLRVELAAIHAKVRAALS